MADGMLSEVGRSPTPLKRTQIGSNIECDEQSKRHKLRPSPDQVQAGTSSCSAVPNPTVLVLPAHLMFQDPITEANATARQQALVNVIAAYMAQQHPIQYLKEKYICPITSFGSMMLCERTDARIASRDYRTTIDIMINRLQEMHQLVPRDNSDLSFLDIYHSNSNHSRLITGRKYIEQIRVVHEAAESIDQEMCLNERACSLLILFLRLVYRKNTFEDETFEAMLPEEEKQYNALDRKVQDDIILEKFLATFQDRLIEEHLGRSWICQNFYVRGIVLVQSSGSGKSRLLRQVGSRLPSFVFALNSSASMPWPDGEVIDFLELHCNDVPGRCLLAALLSALFRELYLYLAACYHEASSLSQDVSRGGDFNLSIGALYGTRMAAMSAEAAMREGLFAELEKRADDLVKSPGSNKIIVDICGYLQDLRGGARGTRLQEIRSQFLLRVVEKAKGILPVFRDIDPEVIWSRKYLDLSGMSKNLVALFELIDQVPRRPLSCKAKTDACKHQLIFAVDGICHSISFRADVKNKRSEICLSSILSLFHDLEEDTFGGESGKKPFRRVWIVFTDDGRRIRYLKTPVKGEIEIAKEPWWVSSVSRNYISVWHDFGMNHGLVQRENSEANYLNDVTMGQLNQFQYLKLTGRGLWSTCETSTEVFQIAKRKLGLDRRQWNLWESRPAQIKKAAVFEDLTAFALASLRFGLDNSLMLSSKISSSHPIIESIVERMRSIVGLGDDASMKTATPGEPILAAIALSALKYGQSIDEVTTTWKHDEGVAWGEMLKMIGAVIEIKSDFVPMGKDAQLVGRIVLSRARDCTLPLEYNKLDFPTVPWTTLGHLIEQLIGKDAATALRSLWIDDWLNMKQSGCMPQKTDWCSRVWKALVNFTQFVSLDAENVNSAAVTVQHLEDAFTKTLAYFCTPGTSGPHAMIPIMVPKEELYIALLLGEQKVEDTKMADYDLEYVAIRDLWNVRGGEDSADPPLFSPCVEDEQGKVKSDSAVLVILMDKAARKPFISLTTELKGGEEESELVASFAQPITEWVAGGVERQSKVHVEDRYAYFLSLRIRGMNCAYPCMAAIDEKHGDVFLFEESIKKAMS